MQAPRLIFLADQRNREHPAIARLAHVHRLAATTVSDVRDLDMLLSYDPYNRDAGSDLADSSPLTVPDDFESASSYNEPTLVVAPFFTKLNGALSWLPGSKPREVATLDQIGDLLALNPNARILFISDSFGGEHLDSSGRTFKFVAPSTATKLEQLHHPRLSAAEVKGTTEVVAVPAAKLDEHLRWFNSIVRGEQV